MFQFTIFGWEKTMINEKEKEETLEGTRRDEIFEGVDEKLFFIRASFFSCDSLLLLLLAASARQNENKTDE